MDAVGNPFVTDAPGNPFVTDAPGNPFTQTVTPEPDMTPIRDYFESNLKRSIEEGNARVDPPSPESPRVATDWLDAMQAGWQMSVSGLATRGENPDVVLPPDASMASNILAGIPTLAGDLPALLPGMFLGAAAGTAAAPGLGTAVGGGAGAMALPAAVRSILMQHYAKGDIHDFRDFWERSSSVFWDTAKQGVIGGLTAGAGSLVGRVAAPTMSRALSPLIGETAAATVAPTVATTARLTTEIGTMTSVGAALEGHVPTAKDFVQSALMVGVLHGAGKALRGGTNEVTAKMREIYAKTGIHPAQVAEDAKRDPFIQQDLLSTDPSVPKAYGPDVKTSPELNTVQGPDGVQMHTPIDKTEPTNATLSESEQKIWSRVTTKDASQETSFSPKEFVVKSAKETYRQVWEEYAPIGDLADALSGGKKLLAMEDPKRLYQAAQSAGIAQRFLKFGVEDYHTKQTVSRGLEDILSPFEKDAVELTKFKVYALSSRALEVAGQGKDTGMDLAAARDVVKNGKAKYDKTFRELVDFQNKTLNYLADSGRFSKEQVKAMDEAGKNFVPLNRLVEGGKNGFGVSVLSKPVKKLKGSSAQVIDPVESIIKNVIQLSTLAEKSRVTSALVDLALEHGPGGLKGVMERVPRKQVPIDISHEINQFKAEHGIEGDAESFVAFRPDALRLQPDEFPHFSDGKIQIWKADPLVANLIKGGDRPTLSVWEKVFRLPAKALTVGATTTLEFTLRNPIVDALTAWSTEGAVPIYTQLVGLRELWKGKNSEVYQTWLSGGGSMKSAKEINEVFNRYRSVYDLDRQTGVLGKTWNGVRTGWDALVMLKDISEMSTRIGVTAKAMKGLALTPENIYGAGLKSRTATIDFLRSGAKIRAANQAISFLSVQMQALDITAHGLKDPAFLARTGSLITTTSVMLWWANKDDERYKNTTRVQKDLFWIIPTDKWVAATQDDMATFVPDYLQRMNNGVHEINKGVVYKIPKPHEIGILFGSLPERVLEYFFTDNPRALKDFNETMAQAFIPGVLPVGAIPVLEQWANKSFFTGHKIIPAHLEGASPDLQYTEYTTDAAKALGKMSAYLPGVNEHGVSPAVIENYVRSWTGGLGQYALQIADGAIAGKRTLLSQDQKTKPDKTLADIPGVKAFVLRYPSASSQYIQDFYDRYSKVTTKLNDLTLLAKKIGTLDEWQERFNSMHADEFAQLSGYKDALSKATEYIGLVNDMPISGAQKRQLIDGQYHMMIETAKNAVQFADEFEKQVRETEKSARGIGGK